MPEGATVNVPLKLAERAQARPDLVEVVFDQSLAGTYMEVAAYNAFIAAEASVWPRAWLAEITLRAILPDGNVVEFTSPASWSPLGFCVRRSCGRRGPSSSQATFSTNSAKL